MEFLSAQDSHPLEFLSAELAIQTHFEVTPLSGAGFEVKNLRLDRQPRAQKRNVRPVPAGPEEAPEADQAEESSPDIDYEAYGFINGGVPPLILGERVYEWCFAPTHLKHATRLKHSVQLVWQEAVDGGEVREFGQQDFLGVCYPDQFYVAGGAYTHIVLTDTLTQERHTAAFSSTDFIAGRVIMHSSCGLYLNFPKPDRFCRSDWEPRKMPQAPFNYFGTTPRGKMNRTTEELLVKYVYAVHYWGICYTTGFAVPRDVVEREAGEWTARVLKTACMFSDRKTRKYGYTPLKG